MMLCCERMQWFSWKTVLGLILKREFSQRLSYCYTPSSSKPVWVSFFCWTQMISLKYLLPRSTEERNLCRFGTTWEWENDEKMFIFGWTIPLSSYHKWSDRCSCLILTCISDLSPVATSDGISLIFFERRAHCECEVLLNVLNVAVALTNLTTIELTSNICAIKPAVDLFLWSIHIG